MLTKKQLMIGFAALAVILVSVATTAWWVMLAMPGHTHTGPLPPLTKHEVATRDTLQRDIEMLAGKIGERHIWKYDNLAKAADYIEAQMQHAGYNVERQGYEAEGKTCYNLIAQITGTDAPDEIVVIGGHYDTVRGSPGANDNATGTAAVLAIARALTGQKNQRTIRFVAFVNEESPFAKSPDLKMGSWVYANRCRERGERIVAMLSLETIGSYSDDPDTQQYPYGLGLLYPSTGNFVTFVGNIQSRGLVRQAVGAFRRHTRFPSEGIALPASVPAAKRSDHWSFWRNGYPGLMVTDTANFRYAHYHATSDTPDKIDFDRLARVVAGLEKVITELASF